MSDEAFNDAEKVAYGVKPEQPVDSSLDMSPERIRHKIDWRVLPYFSLLYLMSFLDRVNIGQAKTAGLIEDLNLVGNQFQIASTLLFVSYVAFEIPSNLALKWLKPHRWITFIMLSWGLCMTFMGFCTNAGSLYAVRFLLGLFEGGLFPGLNLILTAYYSREELNMPVGILFGGATLSGAFGGLLAYGIRHMDGIGGKAGWAWLFILEGLLTVVIAIPAWWLVPDFPDEEENFLTPEEKAKWLHHLKKSQGITSTPLPFSGRQISRAFKDWKVWVYGIMYLAIATPFYSLSLFVPSIIVALGYQSWQANLLSVPPYVFGFITVLVTAYYSDRTRLRSPFIVGWMLIVCVAYALFFSPVAVGVKYFAIFLAVGGASPCIATAITYIGNNIGPLWTRSAAMGLFFSFGNSAGIVASNVYPADTAPKYYPGHGVALGTSVLAIACALVLGLANKRENLRRDSVYGKSTTGALTAGEVLSKDAADAFGHTGMTEQEIIELGDKHPGFRYLW